MNAPLLLPDERRRALLEQLRRDGRVVAAEAANAHGVSEDSIRRDLRALAAEGLAQRVHGGALPAQPIVAFPERVEAVGGPAAAIAATAAARLAEIGGIVVLDNGTTNLLIAQSLEHGVDLTIVTSSPAIGAAASERGLDVLMLGGHVSPEIGGAVDYAAIDALREIRADVAVVGACAIHPEHGLAGDRPEESGFKRAAIESGAEVIVPAAAEKLGSSAPYAVAPITAVTTLVTDAAPDDPRLARFAATAVEILHA